MNVVPSLACEPTHYGKTRVQDQINAYNLRSMPLAMSLVIAVWLITPGTLATEQQGTAFNRLEERAKRASEENRLDEAGRLYTKALALRPRWAEGWWSLGTLQYDRDHYAEAAQAFEKLLSL